MRRTFITINNRKIARNRLLLRRRNLSFFTEIFDLSPKRFIGYFRLPKRLCMQVIQEIVPHMRKNCYGLSRKLRFLVALRFYAQGSYQSLLGPYILFNLSQTSISRCVAEVSDVINKHLLQHYVKFPLTEQDLSAIRETFYRKYNFPGVCGCIAGTHIKIKKPPSDIEHVYFSRCFSTKEKEGFHSIKLQIVCDIDLKILDCNARFGGPAYNGGVFGVSALKIHLEQKYSSGSRDFWLLGNTEYPQLPYLMTPIGTVGIIDLSEDDLTYNRQHKKALSCIDRCIDVLKSQFRCLHSDNVLPYHPVLAGKIINSCIVLHNILIINGFHAEENCSKNSAKCVNK